MHILVVEYPGHGVYYTSQSSELKIKQDAVIVYDYLTQCVGLKESDIIVMGNSLGTGPTSYLASIRHPYFVALLSGYKSIQEVVKAVILNKTKFFGSILSMFCHDVFKNRDCIRNSNCPVFLLHGKADELIPWTNSRDLHMSCPQPTYLRVPEQMKHNYS